MASLPSFGALSRAKSSAPSAAQLIAPDPAKLNLAHRLHAQDTARRTTSVAPPRSVA